MSQKNVNLRFFPWKEICDEFLQHYPSLIAILLLAPSSKADNTNKKKIASVIILCHLNIDAVK